MTMIHILDPMREICLACGRTRQQLVEQPMPRCDGTLRTREWLRGTTWSREVVIP